MDTRARWTSIGIAGVVMGLLGNLPVLNLVNCILCVWVWLGGGLAVVLYRRSHPGEPSVTGGPGAGLGALAGVVGALFGAIVYFLTASLSEPIMLAVMKALNVNLPVGVQNPGSALGGTFFWLVVDLVLYPLFGALGGLVTASLGAPKPVDPTTGSH